MSLLITSLFLTPTPPVRYKLLAQAYPYMASRLLTDPAPELRTSFEDLIIKVSSSPLNPESRTRAAYLV